jgi:hypothetical protein
VACTLLCIVVHSSHVCTQDSILGGGGGRVLGSRLGTPRNRNGMHKLYWGSRITKVTLHFQLVHETWISGQIRRIASSGMLRRVALVGTDVSEELSASIIRVTRIGELGTTLAVVTPNVFPTSPILVTLMMEALSSSGTSVPTRTTRRNIPEDATLHSNRRENLKYYIRTNNLYKMNLFLTTVPHISLYSGLHKYRSGSACIYHVSICSHIVSKTTCLISVTFDTGQGHTEIAYCRFSPSLWTMKPVTPSALCSPLAACKSICYMSSQSVYTVTDSSAPTAIWSSPSSASDHDSNSLIIT